LQFNIGRQLVQWNQLDDNWKLGIWQSRYRWDYLNPESSGLLGGFLNVEAPLFKLVVFGSPIYIPERGVSQTIRPNGSVVSNSVWNGTPPAAIKIPGTDQLTPVDYTVAMPPLGEILVRPSISIQTRVGGDQEGPWISAGYAYKPINQVILGYTSAFPLAADDAPRLAITLYPRFIQHHLVGVDTGWDWKNLGASLSFLYENPIVEETPASWTAQQLTRSYAISPSFYWKLGTGSEGSPRVDLSYLHQWGGNAPDLRPQIAGPSSFEYRYPFQDALQLKFNTSLPWGGMNVGTRLLYEFSQDGLILSAGVQFRPWKGLAWRDIAFSVSGDLLISGAFSGKPRFTNDFISAQQDNDRVTARLSYVF
jgi:hypothetical protein